MQIDYRVVYVVPLMFLSLPVVLGGTRLQPRRIGSFLRDLTPSRVLLLDDDLQARDANSVSHVESSETRLVLLWTTVQVRPCLHMSKQTDQTDREQQNVVGPPVRTTS